MFSKVILGFKLSNVMLTKVILGFELSTVMLMVDASGFKLWNVCWLKLWNVIDKIILCFKMSIVIDKRCFKLWNAIMISFKRNRNYTRHIQLFKKRLFEKLFENKVAIVWKKNFVQLFELRLFENNFSGTI